mmetsp:Transcript_174042/g.552533  ORF Transcript_174042/g.552533 Transcript_174042/m.552533 type:complete len:358 (+) Transcript_174042:3-1076(+)
MNYSKYTNGGAQGGGAGGDYKQYMNYSQYMNGGAQGGGSPAMLDASNPSAPASAADCNTTEQLKAWRKQSLGRVDQYTPEAYQHFAEAPIEQEYSKNLARITGQPEPEYAAPAPRSAADCKTEGQLKAWRKAQEYSKNLARITGQPEPEYAAPAPRSAADCKTEGQLKAWREAQEKQINQWVPKGFQSNALKPIEQDYEKNLARIKAPTQDSGAHAPADKSRGKSDDTDRADTVKGSDDSDKTDDVNDRKKSDHHADGNAADGKAADGNAAGGDASDGDAKGEEKADEAAPVAAASSAAAPVALAAAAGSAALVLPVMLLLAFGVPAGYAIRNYAFSRRQRTQDDLDAPFVLLDAVA